MSHILGLARPRPNPLSLFWANSSLKPTLHPLGGNGICQCSQLRTFNPFMDYITRTDNRTLIIHQGINSQLRGFWWLFQSTRLRRQHLTLVLLSRKVELGLVGLKFVLSFSLFAVDSLLNFLDAHIPWLKMRTLIIMRSDL